MTFTILSVGAWMFRKAKAQQAQNGTQAAARNLRKQGVPVELAVELLARGIR